MGDEKSFVKLYRKFTKWGWYSDPATKAVFLHLLLTANWQDGEFLGEKVRAGECVFGRKKAAKILGLSEQNVRTALDHLRKTGEISTTKSTNRFSIIKIEKWAFYQGSESEPNQQTNQALTSSQPHPRKEEVKNNILLPKGSMSSKAEKDPRKADREEVIRYLNEKTGRKYKPSTESTKRLINGRFREGFTVEDFKKVIDNKSKEWLGHPKMDRFLRPETLFAPSHFEGYLNESGDPPEVDELTARLGTVL